MATRLVTDEDGVTKVVASCSRCQTMQDVERVDVLAVSDGLGEHLISVDLCEVHRAEFGELLEYLAAVGVTGLIEPIPRMEHALLSFAVGKPSHRDTRIGANRRDRRRIPCPLCRRPLIAAQRYQHLQSAHGMSRLDANGVDFPEIDGHRCLEESCRGRMQPKKRALESHYRSRHPDRPNLLTQAIEELESGR